MKTNLLKVVEAQIEALIITNDSQLKEANELAKVINKQIAEIKAEYKEPKAEALKKHKIIVAEEKERLAPWERFKKIQKDAIGKYLSEQEKKRQLLIEEQKKEQEIFGEAIIEVEEKPSLGGTHLREVWDVEIVDESKVPISWNGHVIRNINMSALKEIARMEKGNADIEGVKFVKKQIAVIR